jgi:hypothetical protein
MQAAELKLVEGAQKRHFAKELTDIKHRGKVAANSKLLDLDPRMENGLLYTGSRLRFSKHAKKLLILPKKDPTTKLVIRRAHTSNGHIGPEQSRENCHNSMSKSLFQRYPATKMSKMLWTALKPSVIKPSMNTLWGMVITC